MNIEQMNNNKVFITGEIVSQPIFSHTVFDENFYDFEIKISRLSGTDDILPVTISDRIIDVSLLSTGTYISGSGQFRSYNKQVNEKSKLLLTAFLREINILKEILDYENYIELHGFVCKEPIYRTTPFKREICDLLIAVNRSYNKSDYLPCIAWGKNANLIKDCKVGDKISVSGRIQSRLYQKKINDTDIIEKVAYEISISKIDKTINIKNQNNEMELTQEYYAKSKYYANV